MPGDHGAGLDDDEELPPPRPVAGEKGPQDAIERTEPWSLAAMVEGGELLAEDEVLGDEMATRMARTSGRLRGHLEGIGASAPPRSEAPWDPYGVKRRYRRTFSLDTRNA
jgi:hypothetical protein